MKCSLGNLGALSMCSGLIGWFIGTLGCSETIGLIGVGLFSLGLIFMMIADR